MLRRPVGLRQVDAAAHDRRARGDHRRRARRSTASVMNDVDADERGVAMVFQSYALYPHMTVAENMGFALKHRRRRRKAEREQQVQRGGADAAARPAARAQARRSCPAASASASPSGARSCAQPKVFLFDEPLSNLDAALRVQMRVELAELHRELERDDDLRHPRPGRGDDHGRPHRRPARRRDRAGRHPARALHATRPTPSSPASSARRR